MCVFFFGGGGVGGYSFVSSYKKNIVRLFKKKKSCLHVTSGVLLYQQDKTSPFPLYHMQMENHPRLIIFLQYIPFQ